MRNVGYIGLGEEALNRPDKARWNGLPLTLFLKQWGLEMTNAAPPQAWHSFWKSTSVRQLKEERVNHSRVVIAGAVVGALIGAAATYLFYTDAGKHVRERLEPAVDDLRREFGRFQKTIEKLGEMANDGIRVVNEFNAARSQSSYPDSRTSH